jgi:hypothetical protein
MALLGYQNNILFGSFFFQLVPDLLEFSGLGFFFFMRNMGEKVMYHDIYIPFPKSLAGTIKKRGWHFKSPRPSFLDNQPQQSHLISNSISNLTRDAPLSSLNCMIDPTDYRLEFI